MNTILIIILSIVILQYVFNTWINWLDHKNSDTPLPDEFKNIYDEEKYTQSIAYHGDLFIYSNISGLISLFALLFMLLGGGFNYIDILSGYFSTHEILRGVIFSCILILGIELLSLPFSYYEDFVIEEKYGFNKKNKKIFFMDFIKSNLLTMIIGLPLLSIVLYFFEYFQENAWLIVWGVIILFQIIMVYLSPWLILPLFNKYTPPEDEELKNKIESFLKKHGFKFKGIYQEDSSKRGTRGNAYFIGFGSSKRIVLYDTLIKKHTHEEIISILAHELGHYRLKHIPQMMFFSVFQIGLILFTLNFFITYPPLHEAFGMERTTIYGGIVFFGFLYSPIGEALSFFMNRLSRHNENKADEEAVKMAREPETFIQALKKLSRDNYSNLTPHPLKVLFHYSHPPILQRIKSIRDFAKFQKIGARSVENN